MSSQLQAMEASHAMNDTTPARTQANASGSRASARAAASLVAALFLAVCPADARRAPAQDDLDAADAPPAVSELRLDFDSRPGVTIIGITSSVPLTSHTVYESDATSTTIEIPSADVSGMPEVAQVGTPEVERILVENVAKAGEPPLAHLTIVRERGSRRDAAVDAKNPRRLEVTISAPEGAAPQATQPAAAPVKQKVLASAPAAPAPKVAVVKPTEAPAPRPAPVEEAPKPAPARRSPQAAQVAAAVTAPEPESMKPVAEVAARDRLLTPSYAGGADVSALGGLRQDASATEEPGPARLTGVTVEKSADGRTVLRLAATKSLEVNPFVLDSPPRLALDIAGAVNAVDRGTMPVRMGGVQQVRVAQNKPLPEPVVRIVVDLDSSMPYQVVPGPSSTLVLIGESNGAAPAFTMADARPDAGDELGSPSRSVRTQDVQAPDEPASLGNLGRPDTFNGTAPTPLREAAASTGAMTNNPMTQDAAAKKFSYESQAISQDEVRYTGDPISMHYKDADLQDLFRMFKVISGLNIVVDPSIKGKTITLELDDVPWDQALAMVLKTHNLGSSLEGNILRIAPLTKLAQDEQQKQALKDARELAGDIRTIARTLSYASGNAAQSIIRKTLSSRGDVILDTRTNTLLVKDIQGRVEEVERLLDLLDRPTPQVMIEARIVETTKDFSKAVGINWGFTYIADRAFGNSTNFSFPRGGTADYAVNLLPQAHNSELGLSFRNILDTFAIDLTIQALEERGRARIVSSPRIMVQNNERANIESGVQIPISTTTATEINVTFVSASLKLEVTPQITADGVVIMTVSVDNNQPVFLAQNSDQASISTRQARTVVAVPDGGTTIIGGIYQVNESSTQGRVPFLSRIPLLGWLFRNKGISRTNDELLIFITPHIQKA